ncbi:MAG: hypothetical protein M5U26_04585 [Planctomycetota bacterium]|nr:hypothetical protein [Planctomycetota bacterium]
MIATLGGVLLIMGSGGASGETRSRREPAEVRVESVTRTSSTANAPAGSASRPASDPQEPARPQEKSADAPSALQKEFEAVQALMRSSDTPQEERIAAGRAFADKYPGTLEASRVRVQVEKLEAPPEPPRVAEDAPVNDPAPPGGSIESLFRRAQALEREYDREGAIAVYRQILGKEPRHHVALTNMAYCKMALLQLEHALKDAQRAIEIRENFWNAWAVVSVCQYGLGRTEEATAALEKAKQYAVNPTEVAQLILRESSGIRSRYQGKRLEGKDLRSAQEFGLRGQYRLAVRKWSEALEDLDKAAELDPGLAEQGIYTAMADAAGQLKDNARRLGYLRKWAEAQADSAEANNGYAWELLTSADASLRDPKTALPFARKAVEQSFNSNPSILDTLGLALFRNGETKEAIEIQRKAIALLPLDTKAETRKEFEDRLKEFEAAK